jgi:SAM-dependent methyltransferase
VSLKQSIKNLAARNAAFNILYRVLRGCKVLGLAAVNARYRSEYLTRRRYRDRHFQGPTFTTRDRSPIVFEACAKYLAPVTEPKLLSFGCSTGEEAFTLAEYMPAAIIIGVDINEWCVRQCIRKNKSEKLHFYHRLSADFEAESGFDAIFCIAVFQRGENRDFKDKITEGFTFDQFEAEISMLDAKLKPGGLLVVHHSDFSFMDTGVAGHYTPLPFEGNKKVLNRPLFDRDNVRVSEVSVGYRVFVKVTPPGLP